MTNKTKGWAAFLFATGAFVGAASVAGSVVMALVVTGISALLTTCYFIDEAAREKTQ